MNKSDLKLIDWKPDPVEIVWFFIGLSYSILFGIALAFILFVLTNKSISGSVYTWLATFMCLTFFTIFWKIIFLRYLRKKNRMGQCKSNFQDKTQGNK